MLPEMEMNQQMFVLLNAYDGLAKYAQQLILYNTFSLARPRWLSNLKIRKYDAHIHVNANQFEHEKS